MSAIFLQNRHVNHDTVRVRYAWLPIRSWSGFSPFYERTGWYWMRNVREVSMGNGRWMAHSDLNE
ncbi:hypothetical protein KSF73_09640 [Burkholderiaceae bacterium DAT-1]|nr:hypothetical protein [Burkholderiaceae bacterium DAT-1]